MYQHKKYYNKDFESYVANPDKYKEESSFFGGECLPVGINDTFMPTDKFDPNNLDKAQYNIRDRFGYLTSDDTGVNEPE